MGGVANDLRIALAANNASFSCKQQVSGGRPAGDKDKASVEVHAAKAGRRGEGRGDGQPSLPSSLCFFPLLAIFLFLLRCV